MKNLRPISFFLTASLTASLTFYACQTSTVESPDLTPTFMKISSSVFEDQGDLPSKYTCDGEDVNPPLQIQDAPEGTKSLVLIVDDPDAPRGDWVHWLLWNIDPGTKDIRENSVPDGAVQGTTDFGNPAWGGPCPPSGTHRYFFKLYALDTALDLEPSSKKADLESAMQGHVLDQTFLMGNYERAQ